MNSLSRRRFLSGVGTGTAGLTIAPLLSLQSRLAHGAPSFGRGFGPLSPKLPLNTAQLSNSFIGDLRNRAILALPEGFEYTVISPTGDTMSDGSLVPADHDGMAAFDGPRSTTILVRNHELAPTGGDASKPQVTAPPELKYDPVCRGGTTTLVVDNQGNLLRHYPSIAGTFNNCAGGPTPWGSWITCEENTSVPPQGGVTKRHGFNFEVIAGLEGLSEPFPLVDMGRFNHEAIAVDPKTGWVYETEDRGDSLFYRFRPNSYGDLRSGGVLEALVLTDLPMADTRTNFRSHLFQPLRAHWVKIDEVNPAGDTVRLEGRSKGAAVFTRGEGAWYGNGKIYFVCSNGGDAGRGQVFAYDPAADTLTLFLESVTAAELGYTDPSWTPESVAGNGGFVLAAPDNITVGPDGRLYLCEDGSGIEKVVGVNHAGELFEAVRNELNDSEFAGSCFSHDGRFMFLNIQGPGLTCVIRGNWRKGQR
jgi:secreted PhoX family phosphatase